MDNQQFETWLDDRIASDDDDLEDVLAAIGVLAPEDDTDILLLNVHKRQHGGSRVGRSPNILRDHADGHKRIWSDYFCSNPVYPDHIFRRRYRMRKQLFMRIHDNLIRDHSYFIQRPDAIGNVGLSSIQKITAALSMLCYGAAADAVDEYIRIGESTAISCFKNFVEAVVVTFGDEYLRNPTEADVRKHMELNRQRGFVGMFGSLDCTHWLWKNCPVGQQGLYMGKDGVPTMIMEGVATSDLWLWYTFIGAPGSNNDINIIDRSPLITKILKGVAPDVSFQVNGSQHRMFYLLVDGIYPEYSIFMKTIPNPEGLKRKYYVQRQEAVRKDVERTFGVLQARFAMVRRESKWWSSDQMTIIWQAAVILHNMIVEDEATDSSLNHDYLFDNSSDWQPQPERPPLDFSRIGHELGVICNKDAHYQLQADLIEHLWNERGNHLNE
jgi:hypothetical protein